MRELLIAEMKRALELLEAKEKPFKWDWQDTNRSGELKLIMRLIRKHSVELQRTDNHYS